MAGWLFVDAPLFEDEVLLFRRVANRRKGRRTIGGEVNVTDRRLLFVPNRLEQWTRTPTVVVDRDDIGDVIVVPPPPGSERFKGLPGARKARAEIDTPDGLLLLLLDDAALLEQVLAVGR